MPQFNAGDVVESLVNVQGLKLGQRYRVDAVESQWHPMGTFTTYRVAACGAGGETMPVTNGHLVLKLVRSAVPATNNEEWGFWGTIRQAGVTGGHACEVWAEAVGAVASVMKVNTEKARDLLDSRFGRHLADQIIGSAEVGEDIRKLLKRGGSWHRNAAQALAEI